MKYPFAALALTLLAGPTFADPWKDGSGKGRWGYGYYRSYHYDRDYKQESSRLCAGEACPVSCSCSPARCTAF